MYSAFRFFDSFLLFFHLILLCDGRERCLGFPSMIVVHAGATLSVRKMAIVFNRLPDMRVAQVLAGEI